MKNKVQREDYLRTMWAGSAHKFYLGLTPLCLCLLELVVPLLLLRLAWWQHPAYMLCYLPLVLAA